MGECLVLTQMEIRKVQTDSFVRVLPPRKNKAKADRVRSAGR